MAKGMAYVEPTGYFSPEMKEALKKAQATSKKTTAKAEKKPAKKK